MPSVSLLHGGLSMTYSRPFKKQGTLHRWRFYDGIEGPMKALEYFHRKARRWLPSKDEDGVKIMKSRRNAR